MSVFYVRIVLRYNLYVRCKTLANAYGLNLRNSI